MQQGCPKVLAMRFKTKVKILKNDKNWKSMRRNLLRSVDNTIDVGWWGNLRHPRTKMPLAQVAKWNEEGHSNGGLGAGTTTPPRPFMRLSFLPQSKILLMSRFVPKVRLIAEGKLTWTALKEEMKKELTDILKKSILEWNTPDNAPLTIKLKGFDDPLIETGSLYDGIRARVRRRGT